MIVYFTEELSSEIKQKLDIIAESKAMIDDYFLNKIYGDDLKVLYISLLCINPKFEQFFKFRKPNYQGEAKSYFHQGVQVEREAKSLKYDLKLDYETYLTNSDINAILARNIIGSLEIITSIKKISDFDLGSFKSDFEIFFTKNGWV